MNHDLLSGAIKLHQEMKSAEVKLLASLGCRLGFSWLSWVAVLGCTLDNLAGMSRGVCLVLVNGREERQGLIERKGKRSCEQYTDLDSDLEWRPVRRADHPKSEFLHPDLMIRGRITGTLNSW